MRICATLCYVKKNGKTLMLHRIRKDGDIHEGKWNGLGGKMELGESPEDCVIREVKEESGLNMRNPVLKGILTFPGFDGENDWTVFVFVARKFSGRLIKESREGDLHWIEDKRLKDLHLWEGDRVFFKWLKKKEFFSAKFIYRKGRLKRHEVLFY